MTRFFSYLFLVAILLLISCKNESDDAPIIKGTVKGRIQITDSYGYNLNDLSGVEINISSNAYSADTLTDYDGNFLFEDVPFGKYQLTCTKDNYVQQTGHAAFGHAGGEIATTVSEKLLGIPDFGYTIDSMEQVSGCYLRTHIRTYDASKIPAGDYYSIVQFFADTPDVDSDNYDSYYIDYGWLPSGNEWTLSFWCCSAYEPVFSNFTGDSVYCRIYRVPYYHGYSEQEILAQPMGKPSNVFAFKRNF
jgi:hypothetical protein